MAKNVATFTPDKYEWQTRRGGGFALARKDDSEDVILVRREMAVWGGAVFVVYSIDEDAGFSSINGELDRCVCRNDIDDAAKVLAELDVAPTLIYNLVDLLKGNPCLKYAD